MKFLYSDEPIIACSTGNQSHAAMAVLRISGFSSLLNFQKFFSRDLSRIEARKVYLSTLNSGDIVFDEVCLTYFPGPKSYNGENILELSVHGNTLNVNRIIDLFVNDGGCRLAHPGEFTYRALKNKKLTLSQVEGLDLFLNANTGYALDQGLSLLSGDLHEVYLELLDLFLKHKAALELSIDFLDDVGEEAARKQFLDTFAAFSRKFHDLVRRVQPLDFNLVQPEITLAGLPNSGKSSLFNHLLAQDRAIVSAIAGTTRDYLSENIAIEGIRYRLVDTAGIRESRDLIEVEGIRRTKKKIGESFFSILLINPFETASELRDLLEINFDLVLFTHADCKGFSEARSLLQNTYPQLGPMGAINLLSLNRDWDKYLFALVNKKYLQTVSGKPILLDRHKTSILEGSRLLENYEKLIGCESDVAILSHELNTLGHCISELIGIISPDQILNSIFSNFCIGK